MKRGEIRWYKFRPPDKKRPVLILSRDFILEYLGEVTIAPLTSTIRDIPLIYYEACLKKEDAERREKYLETHYGQMFLKKRLKSYFTG